MPETREFTRAECFGFRCNRPVLWIVHEYDNDTREHPAEWVLTCDRHKMEAFS